MRGLASSMRKMVQKLGEHFSAIETVAAEAAAEFGGEDAMQPDGRAMLSDCTARLRTLTENWRHTSRRSRRENPMRNSREGARLRAARRLTHTARTAHADTTARRAALE
jgi:hypothetical protein